MKSCSPLTMHSLWRCCWSAPPPSFDIDCSPHCCHPRAHHLLAHLGPDAPSSCCLVGVWWAWMLSAPQWDLLCWGNLSAEGSCLLFTNLVSAESSSGCAAAQTRGKKKPSDSFSLEIAFNPALQKAAWHSFLFKLLTTGLCETWPCLPCFFVLLLI